MYLFRNQHFQSICASAFLLLGLWVLGPGCNQKRPAEESSTPVHLSPRDWGDDVLHEYAELHRKAGHERPMVHGRNGMIAVTSGLLAARAGLEALRQGGHAVDAAMVAALTQVVLVAGSWDSYAGIMALMVYDARNRQVVSMNAGYNTPLKEDEPLSIPGENIPSGRSVLVPGFMAGLQAAHDRFGRLPFSSLFDPAIYFAEQGIEIDPPLAGAIQMRRDVLTRRPETRRLFTKQDGSLYETGDLFRQSELAETLRKVAERGASVMYRGAWAKRFVEEVQSEGGRITLKDMKSYKVSWEEPVQTTYGDYRILAPGISSRGGVRTIEAFNLMEAAGLWEYGHYTTSSEALYGFSQINRLGYLLELLPQEQIIWHFPEKDLSPEGRIRKDTARWMWQKMQRPDWPFANTESQRQGSRTHHSDGIVVVDSWGNVAAMVHTSNAFVWGTNGIFVGGVSIPNSAAFQQKTIQEAGPGKRLPNAINPLIVFQADRPVLACSATGRGHFEKTILTVVNILDFGMNPKSAVDAPYLFAPDLTSESLSVQPIGEGDFEQRLLDDLVAKGLRIRIIPAQIRGRMIGLWSGIQIDPNTGLLKGAVSRDFTGHAEGY